MRRAPDDDATVRLRPMTPARATTPRGLRPWMAAVGVLLIAAGMGAGSFLGRERAAPARSINPAPAPTIATIPEPPAPAQLPPEQLPPAQLPPARLASIRIGDEAAILAERSDALAVYRMAAAPDILVLVFPTLHAQGETLNRIGALVEKAGLPRDHILSEPALDVAISGAHDTPDTYYFGHDYRTSDILRYFALADAEQAPLRPDETLLRTLLRREPSVAVISLSHDPRVDDAASATILRHELSHGLYFTDAAYAAYARGFWERVLSLDERARFRRFLGNEGYDTANDDLMRNEAQAYLVHTADPRFFNAQAVGMSQARVAELRADFARGMPPSWLRDLTPGAVASPTHVATRPSRPRRRQRMVVSMTARPPTLPPRLRTPSIAVRSAAR